MSKSQKVKELVDNASVIDTKKTNDTIKVWESYRDQALLWRAIALLQIPTTLIALIFAIVLWTTRSITLKVPLKPAPGVYEISQIQDVEFINVATEFVNLIGSYRPNIARRQFEEASKLLIEPMLTKFRNEMLGEEIKAIESTGRTQLFFVDATKTTINKTNRVIVSFIGERQKIVAGRELPTVTSKYTIHMGTIPRNKLNPYGIVVTDVYFENLK